ncbi:small integral membrane protein 13 isoform X2 [Narcine bancroftii]|uniref:small integral membrane protein 13 isoform X2 n=1 Tax=Narcine bancroftii TaxID=1343680 RepID=UPI003831F554
MLQSIGLTLLVLVATLLCVLLFMLFAQILPMYWGKIYSSQSTKMSLQLKVHRNLHSQREKLQTPQRQHQRLVCGLAAIPVQV